MEPLIVRTTEVKELPEAHIVYLKLVKVGPSTLKENNYNIEKILEIIEKQPSFFIIGETVQDTQMSLISILEKFNDKQ